MSDMDPDRLAYRRAQIRGYSIGLGFLVVFMAGTLLARAWLASIVLIGIGAVLTGVLRWLLVDRDRTQYRLSNGSTEPGD